MTNWDKRFLNLSAMVASWSKDPSTKCGCVLVRPDKSIAGIGFNGFPRGIDDDEQRLSDRDLKHQIVIHAEENALMFSSNPYCCTAYIYPIIPCPRCASKLIQAGIAEVVAPKTRRRKCGGMDMDLTRKLLREAGILLREVDLK
jgi:dCMP deaminase